MVLEEDEEREETEKIEQAESKTEKMRLRGWINDLGKYGKRTK